MFSNSTTTSSSATYRPIPDTDDNEDVTPVSNGFISSIAKRAKKLNLFTISIVVVIILIVTAIVSLGVRRNSAKQVLLFESAPLRGVFLSQVTVGQLKSQGFNIGRLTFDNVQCSSEDHAQNICTPPKRKASRIFIDPKKQYQTILGFGGAFTEASANNFYKLPQKVQDRFIELYFGDTGIGYTLGRIHINSCDFSMRSYSFDDVPGDYDLQYFDNEASHDSLEIIPLIQRALQASARPIRLLASPWSPPAWMKVAGGGYNQSMTGSAVPNGLIDTEEVKTTWARYISKFISAYAYKGIKIWAVTPQNEPEFPAPWEACAYTADNEKNFVIGYLGPALRQEHPETLILAFDHNKDHLLMWSDTMLTGHGHKYVDGMAFHWYAPNDDRHLDGTFGYEAVNFTHFLAPDKLLLASEGCSCPGVALGSLVRAERLAHDVLFDLNNWAQGWIDWNLLVDSEGGPNHLNNMCDSPIVTNKDFSDIVVQPKFSYMGHISKFVIPGSQRIDSRVIGSFGFDKVNPNVRPGFELGVYPCEQSTRQMWTKHADGTLGLSTLSQDKETTPIWTFEPLCVGGGYENRPYLNLVFCSGHDTGTSIPHNPSKFTLTKSGQLQDTASGFCVGLANGVAEAGALLQMQTCVLATGGIAKDTQRFFLEPITGEIKSYVRSGLPLNDKNDEIKLCVTAGWPFLTASSYFTTEHKTVVVVMNEADSETHIILSDEQRNEMMGKGLGDLWFGISPRSIQTLVY